MSAASTAMRRRAVTAVAAVVLLACCGGCGGNGGELTMRAPPPGTPAAQLDRRALDLLMRASQSELDVVRCNAIEALVHVAPREAIPEFRKAIAADSPLVRFAGCVAVGKVKDAGALAAARAALADPDTRVRLAAAFACVRLGDGNRAALLVATLNDSPDENLRSDAAYLIGQVGEPKALRRLKLAESREKSNRVQVHLWAAMAALGDNAALNSLLNAAQGDAESRVIALQSLVELRKPKARDALAYRMSKMENYLEARLIAARGLGAIGFNQGFELARENLTAHFDDKDDPSKTFRIRSLSALALGAIGDARALPALAQLAQSESDERTQVAACFAILQITRRK